jgi:NitT/TauT family transport system substrate-binding protein
MNKYIKKIIVPGLVISSLLVGCGTKENSQSTNNQTEKTKVNVGYIPSSEDVLYFIAAEKNYFSEENLDVELFSFANSGEGINGIVSKKIDVGAFGSSAINSFVVKGGDLTSFGGEGSEGSAIIARAEDADKYQDINNIKGKKVATVRLSTADIVLRGYLKDKSIDAKSDVTINELDTPATVIEAIKKGTADVGVEWSPYRTLAENSGLKIVKQTGDIYKNHVCCRQVALTDTLKNNPETYERFMRSLIKAYKFLQEQHEETIKIISKYVTVDSKVIENEVYGGDIGNSPDPDKQKIVEFWKLMNSAGFISSDKDITKYINTEIYKNALDSILKENPNDEVYKKLKADFVE